MRGVFWRKLSFGGSFGQPLAERAYRTPRFPRGITATELSRATIEDQHDTVQFWFYANLKPYDLSGGKYFGFGPGNAGFGQAPFAPAPIKAAAVIDAEFGELLGDELRRGLAETFVGNWMWAEHPVDDPIFSDGPYAFHKVAESTDRDTISPIPEDLVALSLTEAVEEIRTWFFENFEDPARNTPYESAEGGYQWISGGPYETRDIIENVFADTAKSDVIEAAIESIQRQGSEWAPNMSRLADDISDARSFDYSPENLHREMLERIAALENELAKLDRTHVRIGHNRPPERIEPELISPNDRALLAAALELLKAQPVGLPEERLSHVEAAVKDVETIWLKLRNYLAKQGDIFVSAFSRAAGTAAAAGIAYKLLADKLGDVIHAAINWLSVGHNIF